MYIYVLKKLKKKQEIKYEKKQKRKKKGKGAPSALRTPRVLVMVVVGEGSCIYVMLLAAEIGDEANKPDGFRAFGHFVLAFWASTAIISDSPMAKANNSLEAN